MDFSNRFDLKSLPVIAAIFFACGPTSEVPDPGGGIPGTDAGRDTTSTPEPGVDAASWGDAALDGASPRPPDAPPRPPDGPREGAMTMDATAPPSDGTAADAVAPPRDVAVADATTPPSDATPPPPPDGAPDPQDLIREMLGRFQPADLEAKYRQMQSMSVPDRYTKTAPYTAVTEWVREMMTAEAPQAIVRFEEWEGYRNVEIAIKGTDPTAGIYVLGGHIDTVRNTVGMGDNGSGGLGMALIARAMAHYRYKAEIRLVIFDAEEIGLIGSAYYAKALKATGCEPQTCLKVYINVDEIGYDPQARRSMRLWTDVPAMQMLFSQVNTDYTLGLTLTPGTGSCHRSDDCSFSTEGYPTVYEFQGGGQSPYNHLPSDTLDTLDITTLTKQLQIAAGVVATAAVPVGRYP